MLIYPNPPFFYLMRRRNFLARRERIYSAEQQSRKSRLIRYPKRTRIEINEDLGDSVLQKVITFPIKAFREERQIPLEKNPDLEYVFKGNPIKIAHYKSTDKYFVYDITGNFIDVTEAHDLKALCIALLKHFNAIGKHARQYIIKGELKKWLMKH